jgi:hypothetical protein
VLGLDVLPDAIERADDPEAEGWDVDRRGFERSWNWIALSDRRRCANDALEGLFARQDLPLGVGVLECLDVVVEHPAAEVERVHPLVLGEHVKALIP